MDLRRPQERMVQLGRQAKPSNAFLDLPARQRVAECNKPLETISARVERHFGETGVAEVNAAEELLALVEVQSKERETKEKLMENVETARKRAVNAVKKLRTERKNCKAEVEVRREKKNRARKYSEEVLRRNASAAAQSKEPDAAKQSENGPISLSPRQEANCKVRIIREAPCAKKSIEEDTAAEEPCWADVTTACQSNEEEIDTEPPCSQNGAQSQEHELSGSMSDEQESNFEIDLQEPGIAHQPCPSEQFHCPIDENGCREQHNHHCQGNGPLSSHFHEFENEDTDEGPSTPANDVQIESDNFPSATRLHLKVYDSAHARRLLQSHARQYRDEPEIGMLGVKPGPSELQNGCSGATNGFLTAKHDTATAIAKKIDDDPSKHIVNGWRVVNPFQEERTMSCPSVKGSNQGCQKSTDGLLSNSTVLYMLQQKVADLGIKLPRLCNCHNLSHFDQNYTRHCCMNCPLYRNVTSQERLLKSLLRNYIDL
ncbi:hypothetical protein BSKO_00132 [Bryopsis sp. KO-2023]|nr:hypothetical protein BSKO_00132 [Bryopsis sp. KO-2023]